MRGRPPLPSGTAKEQRSLRLSPAAWAALESRAALRGTTRTATLEALIGAAVEKET